MDKETFRKTNKKLNTIKQVLWKELARITKKHRDILFVQRITNMINTTDILECEFKDWCEPEKRKR